VSNVGLQVLRGNKWVHILDVVLVTLDVHPHFVLGEFQERRVARFLESCCIGRSLPPNTTPGSRRRRYTDVYVGIAIVFVCGLSLFQVRLHVRPTVPRILSVAIETKETALLFLLKREVSGMRDLFVSQVGLDKLANGIPVEQY
jgi:hypothetical protein